MAVSTAAAIGETISSVFKTQPQTEPHTEQQSHAQLSHSQVESVFRQTPLKQLLASQEDAIKNLTQSPTTESDKQAVDSGHVAALRGALSSALFLTARLTQEPRNLLVFGSSSHAAATATVILQQYPSIPSCTVVVAEETPEATALLDSLSPTHQQVEFRLVVAPKSYEDRTVAGCVHNADIIVVATTATDPLFNSVDVRSGGGVVCCGDVRQVDTELVRRAGRVVVECAAEDTEEELGAVLAGTAKAAEGDVAVFRTVECKELDDALAKVVDSQTGAGEAWTEVDKEDL